MKSLEEVLLCEAYEPNEYGGSAQGTGFYIVIDNKQGMGAGGVLDVKINGNKISIKEKSKPTRGEHDAFLCFEKAGNYELDIQSNCSMKLRIGGACKIGNLKINTSGHPLGPVYLEAKKCDRLDLKGSDAEYVGLDNLTAIKDFVAPTSKECGFRIAKCNNLESVDLSGIQNTPAGMGRLYIRNCKKLAAISLPQAISMPLQFEKLPAINAGAKQLAQKLCDKCKVQFYDM